MVFPTVAPPDPHDLIWRNLNLHYIRKLSCKYDCQILAQSFWRRFLNDPTPFLYCCNFLFFEEDLALYLKNLKFPLPKDDVYQVWLKLACWFWSRRFFKIFSVFLLFCYYLPLGEGFPLHLNNLESSPPKDDLCHVWSKLAQWFWRRSRKCKSLQTDRDGRRTTYRWSEKLVNFQLRWASKINHSITSLQNKLLRIYF
jgi:hypothetical protein